MSCLIARVRERLWGILQENFVYSLQAYKTRETIVKVLVSAFHSFSLPHIDPAFFITL